MQDARWTRSVRGADLFTIPGPVPGSRQLVQACHHDVVELDDPPAGQRLAVTHLRALQASAPRGRRTRFFCFALDSEPTYHMAECAEILMYGVAPATRTLGQVTTACGCLLA